MGRKSRLKWFAASAVACLVALGLTAAVLLARSPGGSAIEESGVYTPANPTVMDAVRDFLGIQAKPVQPIAFTHKVHLAKGLPCDSCHSAVSQGAEAGIPGVNFCMMCHQVIATDRPEIKKVAAYKARGEDIPWVRVYGYSQTAHVKFNHAPHIRAGVECSACHGDMKQQTTAQKVVNLDMGYCLNCHKQRQASTDCVTCHF